MKFSPRITISDMWAVCKALWNKELSGRSDTVKRFEREFAKYCGVEFASSVNSGSSALFLAIKALGLKPGSKIACPAFGYIAIPNAIIQAGYVPSYTDVEIDTGNIDASKIKKGCRAIVAIDTYGHPCDYDALRKIGIPIIQDAAEALGSEYKGLKISGDVACFSFWANKTLTTGEGGMIVTDDEKIFKYVNTYKDACNAQQRYMHYDNGYSLCMGALQAALGISQLKRIEKILKAKRKNVEKLLKFNDNWFTQKEYAKHGMWAFGFMVEDKEVYCDVDPNARPFFYAYNQQPYLKNKTKYPNAEYLSEHGVYYLA